MYLHRRVSEYTQTENPYRKRERARQRVQSTAVRITKQTNTKKKVPTQLVSNQSHAFLSEGNTTNKQCAWMHTHLHTYKCTGAKVNSKHSIRANRMNECTDGLQENVYELNSG